MKSSVKWLIRLMIVSPIIVLLALVGIYLALVTSDIIANNGILDKYHKKFLKIEHPNNTKKIHSFRHVMRPPGNGDDCFYFLGELRHAPITHSNIEEFYSGAGSDGEFGIQFAENGKFSEAIPYGFNDASQFEIKEIFDPSQRLYIIYWLIPDYLSPYSKQLFDIRCK